MELVVQYERAAYNGHFNFAYQSCNLRTEPQRMRRFLLEKQRGCPMKSRLTMANIETVIGEPRLQQYDVDFTSKLVIQKANFDVREVTKANGVTTELLFLIRRPGQPSEWSVYGYAKGRYRDLDIFNINDDAPLGYSYYYSLQEKQCDLSHGLSRSISFRSLLEKLQKDARKKSRPLHN